jgi:hypothetical protein
VSVAEVCQAGRFKAGLFVLVLPRGLRGCGVQPELEKEAKRAVYVVRNLKPSSCRLKDRYSEPKKVR